MKELHPCKEALKARATNNCANVLIALHASRHSHTSTHVIIEVRVLRVSAMWVSQPCVLVDAHFPLLQGPVTSWSHSLTAQLFFFGASWSMCCERFISNQNLKSASSQIGPWLRFMAVYPYMATGPCHQRLSGSWQCPMPLKLVVWPHTSLWKNKKLVIGPWFEISLSEKIHSLSLPFTTIHTSTFWCVTPLRWMTENKHSVVRGNQSHWFDCKTIHVGVFCSVTSTGTSSHTTILKIG